MTAPEPTPLEAAGFAWWSVHMHVGTWADESPEMRAYYAEQAAKIVVPALAGGWLERVIAARWQAHAADGTSMSPEEFANDFAAAIRAAAGVGL